MFTIVEAAVFLCDDETNDSDKLQRVCDEIAIKHAEAQTALAVMLIEACTGRKAVQVDSEFIREKMKLTEASWHITLMNIEKAAPDYYLLMRLPLEVSDRAH